MIRIIFYSTLFLLLLVSTALAQNNAQIKGTFATASNKEIRITAFLGTKDTLLSQTTTDNTGHFSLSYPKHYVGAATIQVKETTSLIVLLNKENFEITWANFKDFDSVQFTNSKENEWFQKAYTLNLEVQKRLAGLNYLLPLYKNDFNKKDWTAKFESEIVLENNRFEAYLNQLPSSSYVKDYLRYREVLQELQKENKIKEETTAVENAFLALDFESTNLFHSGLAKELFENYIKQVLSLQKQEEVISKLNTLSDIIKKSTSSKPLILNEYSEYLIKQYEKYNLIEVAEKFALSLLDDSKCIVDNQRLPLLEQYKKMSVGNEAPNLILNTTSKYKILTDVPSNYKVIVFGASWCEECQKELPQFKEYSDLFKTKYDTEIIFVSIDTDKEKYGGFIKDLPFINSCDFKGWESQNVKNYYVFATPTIYILNKQNKIVAKPTNAIDTAKWLYEQSEHK